jgi:hypothetical protein
VEHCKKCIACQEGYFKKETVTTPPQSSDFANGHRSYAVSIRSDRMMISGVVRMWEQEFMAYFIIPSTQTVLKYCLM